MSVCVCPSSVWWIVSTGRDALPAGEVSHVAPRVTLEVLVSESVRVCMDAYCCVHILVTNAFFDELRVAMLHQLYTK